MFQKENGSSLRKISLACVGPRLTHERHEVDDVVKIAKKIHKSEETDRDTL